MNVETTQCISQVVNTTQLSGLADLLCWLQNTVCYLMRVQGYSNTI